MYNQGVSVFGQHCGVYLLLICLFRKAVNNFERLEVNLYKLAVYSFLTLQVAYFFLQLSRTIFVSYFYRECKLCSNCLPVCNIWDKRDTP